MRFIKVLIIILFFFVGMMLFIQNYEVLSKTMPLKFNLYVDSWQSIPLPFYFLLLASFLVGALFTLSYFLIEKIRLSAELRSCRSRLGKLEKELNSLRNLPLEGAGLEAAEPKAKKEKAKKEKVKAKDMAKEEAKSVEAPAPEAAVSEPEADTPAASEPSGFSADFLTSGPSSFGDSGSGGSDDSDKS